MNPFDESRDALLGDARRRGEAMMGGIGLAPGLDQLTIYAGLVGSALELAKLIQTEQRDLTVIHHHHDIEIAKIDAAFGEIEQALLADFQSDETLRKETFSMIEKLIAAGQFEIASVFHQRLFDGPKRSLLELVVQRRNDIGQGKGTRITLS